MSGSANPAPKSSGGDDDRGKANAQLLRGAQSNRLDMVKSAMNSGADVGTADPLDGLTALHIAVGTNNLPLAKFLIEDCKAPIGPDRLGRWPTIIAAECNVSDELSEYILMKEAEAITPNSQ